MLTQVSKKTLAGIYYNVVGDGANLEAQWVSITEEVIK